jgi:hypothetical protein
MKDKIITDNSTWIEGIGKGLYDPNKLKRLELISTNLNAKEFLKSPLLLSHRSSDYFKVRNGIRAMFRYTKKWIFDSPPNFILKKASVRFVSEDEENIHDHLIFLKSVADDNSTELPLKQRQYLESASGIKEKISKWQKMTDESNEDAVIIKQRIKVKPVEIERTKDFVTIAMREWNINFNPENLNWADLELYLHASALHSNLSLSSDRKQKLNTFFDLAYLNYVSATDKIWSMDGGLITLIKNCKMEKYLFSLD